MDKYVMKTKKEQHPSRIWNAALYLRLSRDDDKYESESISSQRELLLDFINSNPDMKVYDIYIDDGWTGTNFDRPEFKRMEADLRAKKIDCIIVKDLSRFGRNCIEIGSYLNVVFPYLKTRFICINDNVDSYLDPESLDALSTKFKNLINDEYCRDISVKVKSSLTIRRENGEYIGSFPCYGYEKSKEDYHKLVVDPEAAEVVRSIFRRFISGESIRGIVKSLNEGNILTPALYKKRKYPKYSPSKVTSESTWTQRTVRRILTNRMYVGDMVQNIMNNISYRIQKCRAVEPEKRIIVADTHEAIISREDFKRAEDLLSRDTYVSPKTKEMHALSGFIKCGDCKRGMIRKTLNNGWKDYHYFICSTYKNRDRNACSKHTISAEKVERAVLEFIKMNIAFAVEIEPIICMINSHPEREKRISSLMRQKERHLAELTKYKKLREELYPDFKSGLIDQTEYETFRNKYEIKIAQIESVIAELEVKIDEIGKGDVQENAFISNFKRFGNITVLSREVVSALIDNVYVYEDNRIEIVMKYRDEYEAVMDYVLSHESRVLESAVMQGMSTAVQTASEG